MTVGPIDELSQLIANNEKATEETIDRLIGDLLIKCVGDLDELGIERPEQVSVLLAADVASGAVLDWHSKGRPDDAPEFRKLDLAAKLLNALALLEKAHQSTDPSFAACAPRLIEAAWLVGSRECMRALVKLGYLDGYAQKKFNSWRASEHAKDNAQSRKAKACKWKSQALKDFKSRTNRNVSREAWAASNHQRYGVKAGTLAKALQRASSGK